MAVVDEISKVKYLQGELCGQPVFVGILDFFRCPVFRHLEPNVMRIKDIIVRYQMRESLLLDGVIAVLKKLHIVELAQILGRNFQTKKSL